MPWDGLRTLKRDAGYRGTRESGWGARRGPFLFTVNIVQAKAEGAERKAVWEAPRVREKPEEGGG